jgi:ribosomal protein S1
LEDGVEGLLHISELSHERVAKPEDIVSIDQELWLKIIKLDANERKLGLSLRAYLDARESSAEEHDQASPDQCSAEHQEERVEVE